MGLPGYDEAQNLTRPLRGRESIAEAPGFTEAPWQPETTYG
jgi:hypothetical protein